MVEHMPSLLKMKLIFWQFYFLANQVVLRATRKTKVDSNFGHFYLSLIEECNKELKSLSPFICIMFYNSQSIFT